jgi:branched-chain amino acid transport system permease protein
MLDGVLRLHLGEGFVQITYTKVFILVASFRMLLLTWIIGNTRLADVPRGTAGSQNGLHSRDQHRQDYLLVFVIGAAMAGLAGC